MEYGFTFDVVLYDVYGVYMQIKWHIFDATSRYANSITLVSMYYD